jgi:hypothetical protein
MDEKINTDEIPEIIKFNSAKEFLDYIDKRYGLQISREIRSALEYTGDPNKPVEYTYWEHDGNSQEITFYKSLADKEFPVIDSEQSK